MSNLFAVLDTSDSEAEEVVKKAPPAKAPTNAATKKVTAPKAAGAKAPSKPQAAVAAVDPVDKKPREEHGGKVNKAHKATGKSAGGNGGGNKREFDRKSGTGRGKEISKDGAGGHNWGKATDPVPAEEAAAEGETSPKPEVDGAEAGAEAETPVEPEVKQITFDEYLKSEKAKTRTHTELFKEAEERTVEAPSDADVVSRDNFDDITHPDLLKAKKEAKTKERKEKTNFDASMLFVGAPIRDERFREERGERREQRGGRSGEGGRGGRGGAGGRGRGGRGGAGRGGDASRGAGGPIVKESDFPAL